MITKVDLELVKAIVDEYKPVLGKAIVLIEYSFELECLKIGVKTSETGQGLVPHGWRDEF